jgi:hypothetical protein
MYSECIANEKLLYPCTSHLASLTRHVQAPIIRTVHSTSAGIRMTRVRSGAESKRFPQNEEKADRTEWSACRRSSPVAVAVAVAAAAAVAVAAGAGAGAGAALRGCSPTLARAVLPSMAQELRLRGPRATRGAGMTTLTSPRPPI